MVETIALNCFVFEKIVFCVRTLATDRKKTDRRTDGQNQSVKAVSLWRASLNMPLKMYGDCIV